MVTATRNRHSNRVTASPQPSSDGPLYELRLVVDTRNEWRLEIWQLPSVSTPRLRSAEQVAALQGAPLRIVENRVLKRLARANIRLGAFLPGKKRGWPIDEDLALTLGLLFRALAPMRSLDRMRQVADGIEAMTREEAAYWLGMAMHRKSPRRVLAALRILLTMPSS